MGFQSKKVLKANIKTLLDSDIIDSIKYMVLSQMYEEVLEVASNMMFDERLDDTNSELIFTLEYVDIIKRAMNFISPAAHMAKGSDLPEKAWDR